MNIYAHKINDTHIAEISSSDLVIQTKEDGLDVLGNLYYQGFDSIILYEKNITPAFFDLKTGIAGEILQKFSTYRVRLAIVGTFSAYHSKSIRDFMVESNRVGHIHFVATLSVALYNLSSR